MCAVPQNPWGLSRRQVLARLLSGWVYCVLKRAGQLCGDLVSFPEPSGYPIWYQITSNKKTGLQDTGCSGLPRVCWQWDRVGAALWGYNTSRDCGQANTNQSSASHPCCLQDAYVILLSRWSTPFFCCLLTRFQQRDEFQVRVGLGAACLKP